MKKLLAALVLAMCSIVSAQEQLESLTIEGRENDSIPILKNVKSSDAVNLILIPGGNSGTGEIINGLPSSQNFLVRSRGKFQSTGFNTYVLFRAKSVAPNAMATTYRNDQEHLKEILSLINNIEKNSSGPIWIIGTSMGTISATNAALNLKSQRLKGIVLTASVTQKAPGNLSKQKLEDIRMPVLMLHHESDACFACVPSEAKELFKNFSNAPTKEFSMISGGGPALGDACQNQHWHGFVGVEEIVTNQISKWIRDNS